MERENSNYQRNIGDYDFDENFDDGKYAEIGKHRSSVNERDRNKSSPQDFHFFGQKANAKSTLIPLENALYEQIT